jgi:hypothetical protein
MMDDTLNNLEAQILRFLEAHQGREFSISRKDLVEKINGEYLFTPLRVRDRSGSETFEISERKIRATIKHLVESHGEWIGSCAKGYFLIQTDEELITACKYYHGYAMSLLHVEAKLRKTSLPALLGQLSLEFSNVGAATVPTSKAATVGCPTQTEVL